MKKYFGATVNAKMKIENGECSKNKVPSTIFVANPTPDLLLQITSMLFLQRHCFSS